MINEFCEFRFEPTSVPQSSFLEGLRKPMDNPILDDVCFVVENVQKYHKIRPPVASRR